MHGLAQQHAVGTKFEDGAGSIRNIFKANGVAHLLAQTYIHFIGHATGNARGGHAAGLCAGNARDAGSPQSQLQQELWNLRRLTRTRFAFDNGHLVVLHRLHELLFEKIDGQLLTGFQ